MKLQSKQASLLLGRSIAWRCDRSQQQPLLAFHKQSRKSHLQGAVVFVLFRSKPVPGLRLALNSVPCIAVGAAAQVKLHACCAQLACTKPTQMHLIFTAAQILHSLIGRQQVELHILHQQCRSYEQQVSDLSLQLQASSCAQRAPSGALHAARQPHELGQPSQGKHQARGRKGGSLRPCCEEAIKLYKNKYHRQVMCNVHRYTLRAETSSWHGYG